MTNRHLRFPALAGLLLASIALGACSALPPPFDGSPRTDGGGTADPGQGAGGGNVAPPGPGGGSQPGDPGAGIVDPGGGGAVVPDPAGTLVFPKPGVLDPQPVFVQSLAASIEDGHVVVRVEWTSGVEPCYTFAGVETNRDGDAFTLRILEGSTDDAVACIEMAQSKATLVDLGELAPGTYTVAADPSDAEPITVVVP
jgi:hypothetical protein